MEFNKNDFVPEVPRLDLSHSMEMLVDFSREAQKHLISARNFLLILETIPNDIEAIENVFKTFHTIKGLSDFLKLRDIYVLTNEVETMLDMTRKHMLDFNNGVNSLTNQSIISLEQLLTLLDEQIENGGELQSPYVDVGEIVMSIRTIIDSCDVPSSHAIKVDIKSIPVINIEPGLSSCDQLAEKVQSCDGDISLAPEVAKKLILDFQNTSRELKETQSKLLERQRELIKERELALKLAQQSQVEARAVSGYLANMSHEIRTLINAIVGFTNILQHENLSGKQKNHLNTIILSAKMVLGIVNDILDFSKVEAGKFKLENIDFNLSDIVEEVFKIIRTRLTGKPINLYYDIHPEVPLHLIGDPTRLKQIFLNLLDNAIKFTESGEVGLEVRIDKKQKSLANQVVLHFVVRDTGIGVPHDRKDRIFESFTQVDSSTSRVYGGTGLGLSLCKTFIEKMDGEIWVDSDLGKGCKFIFNIKLMQGESGIQSETSTSQYDFAAREVMVVGDHSRTMEKLKTTLENMKFQVLPLSSSAKDALELLLKYEAKNQSVPLVVFIDLSLPEKEGYMLAYKLKQNDAYKNIKLIAVLTDAQIENTNEYIQVGFDGYLLKPIMECEVIEVVLGFLEDNSFEEPAERSFENIRLDQISCEGIKILVVEDSLPNQELLKVHFDDLGCVSDYANNGKEALEFLGNNKYDICFMDLQMPVMGGIEATEKIRKELGSDMPIIALTAAEDEEQKQKCYDVGMNDYLPKPFDVDHLKEIIIKCSKM